MPESPPFDVDALRIASPCNETWDSMTGDERRRRCDRCALTVWNVAELTRAEVADLVDTSEGRLCMRLRRRSDGTVLTADCPVGLARVRRRLKWLAAAVAAAALGTLAAGAASEASTRGGPPGDGPAKVVRWLRAVLGLGPAPAPAPPPPVVMGAIACPPVVGEAVLSPPTREPDGDGARPNPQDDTTDEKPETPNDTKETP